MKKIIYAALLCGSMLAVFSSTIMAAGTMSAQSFRDVNGERFWEVSLKCTADSDKKLIKRLVGRGNPWCSVDNTDLCNEDKALLSNEICGLSDTTESDLTGTEPKLNSTAVGTSNSADGDSGEQDRRNELLREQVQIEERRIIIEQKRLELVKTELRLKKQQENKSNN